jgi:hypothetical protein
MSKPSTASLSVVPTGVQPRLAPPGDLTPEQSALWASVVETKPADWFGEDNAPLLKEYVRAVSMCDALEIQVQTAMAGGEPGVVKGFLDMRDKESKRVASIATKLRLTQQSRYTPKAANTANNRVGAGSKPWQFAAK